MELDAFAKSVKRMAKAAYARSVTLMAKAAGAIAASRSRFQISSKLFRARFAIPSKLGAMLIVLVVAIMALPHPAYVSDMRPVLPLETSFQLSLLTHNNKLALISRIYRSRAHPL